MKQNPEQLLQQFRLPPPSTELRARILAAARAEWNAPAPVSAWTSLRRPLQAVAAALVLLAAGNWTNHRLTEPATIASAEPAAESQWISMELTGFTALRTFRAPMDSRAALAALQSRQIQIRELLKNNPVPSPAPASGSQTRQYRQIPIPVASC